MVGRVGRPALPSNVHLLRGNPSKKPVSELLGEFKPDAHLPDAPHWVKDEAGAEYYRLGEELERYRVISDLDRGLLTLTALSWAIMVDLWASIEAKNAEHPDKRAGMFFTTASGYRTNTPEFNTFRDERREYLKMCNELGCTPASRSKVKPTDGGQLSLPGVGDDANGNDQGGPSLRSFAA